jgi:hypothetical protein
VTTTPRDHGRIPRVARLPLLLLVAGGLATACGSSAPATTATPTPTAAPTPTPSVASGGSGSFCSQANTVLSQIRTITSAAAQPGTSSIAAFKAEIAALTQGLDSGDGTAPSDIAAAIHTMRLGFDQVNAGLQSATTLAQIQAAFAAGESTAVKDAGDQVDAYYKAHCAG